MIVQPNQGAVITYTARILSIERNGLSFKKSLNLLNEKYGGIFPEPIDITEVALFLCNVIKEAGGLGKFPIQKKPFAKTKEFLKSWEWTKLRFQVLKEYGAVCMLCGSKEKICVDHIKPRSKYPELALEFDNLQVLCNLCNKGKGAWDETDFRSH